jgi:hypothetical protein
VLYHLTSNLNSKQSETLIGFILFIFLSFCIMSHGICKMRRFPYNIVWLKETYHNIFQFEFKFEFEGVPLSVLNNGAILGIFYFQLIQS